MNARPAAQDAEPIMSGPLPVRAIAVDFDGTLTADGRIGPIVATALSRVRDRGVRVVLVTGRIMGELRAACPDISDHVDLIVTENGAVLHAPGHDAERLGSAVHAGIAPRLRTRGIPVREGEAILAVHGEHESAVAEVVRELGQECQIIRNRSELMVLPAGVNKGTGVVAALAHLGLSPHDTWAFGDAENDHSLFDACEVGIAVSNAVDSLRARADLVLEQPEGGGVATFLTGSIIDGSVDAPVTRRRLVLAHEADGPDITLPCTPIDVLVGGASGSGKSFVAGGMTEQLIHQGYSVLVLDPEGDHLGLADLPAVVLVGQHDDLLQPDTVVRLLRPGVSVVIDLSTTNDSLTAELLAGLWPEVEAHRRRNGLPHWVVIDEAQRMLSSRSPWRSSTRGHLLVSWHADRLPGAVLARLDAVVAVGDRNHDPSGAAEIAAAVAGVPELAPGPVPCGLQPTIALARRCRPGLVSYGTASDRSTFHQRHLHKYGHARVADDHRFRLWIDPGPAPSGRLVASVAEMEGALSGCAGSTIAHHAATHDVSRWIREVIGDDDLARRLQDIETHINALARSESVESARIALLAALQGAPHHD